MKNDKNDMENNVQSEIIIYQTKDGSTKIDVNFQDETVWLTQTQLCELYQTSKSNISEHIKHIFEEGELEEDSVVRKFRTTGADGKNYNITHYNLDMIISLGYRVKSLIATQFRRWATERLKEYMIKGFTMDDERLKNLGGGNYWKELLDRIRDIRSSEKVMYRQVLDLYATSVDYNPKSSESIAFFKMVQNKLHYAAHGYTAAEVIYERANAEQPFMGLKSFSGDFPTLKDIGYGKQILLLLLEYCRSLGGKEFYYSTRGNNEASKALALSCGFTYQYAEKRTDLRNGKPYQLEVYHKGIEI